MVPQPNWRRLRWIMVLGNLMGGVVAFIYFSFLDTSFKVGVVTKSVRPGQIAYFVAGFTLLAAIGAIRAARWSKPLGGPTPPSPGPAGDEIRRRALLLPSAWALNSFLGWVGAAVVWPILWPILNRDFLLGEALHQIFGITVVAGTTTTVFIFFAVERQWRRYLPLYFPDGALGVVPGAPPLRVRTRLLVVFLMLGLVPVTTLGIFALNRAQLLLTADAWAATAIVQNLILAVSFLVAVAVLTAVGLAVFVAQSVAAPLREVQAAMARVERGALDAGCAVVSHGLLANYHQ